MGNSRRAKSETESAGLYIRPFFARRLTLHEQPEEDIMPMPPMNWTEDMAVNVEVLDDDHKKVFGMINELHEAIMAGHNRRVLEAVLGRLMEYTKIHLARGEEFLASIGYADLLAHKQQMTAW